MLLGLELRTARRLTALLIAALSGLGLYYAIEAVAAAVRERGVSLRHLGPAARPIGLGLTCAVMMLSCAWEAWTGHRWLAPDDDVDPLD